MKQLLSVVTFLLVSMSFSGCEKRDNSAMSEVHWDRDMCARCVMVVSDRMNTVQVKDPKSGKSYMFDDLGCAVLWFEDEKIPWADEAIIWINDNESGAWIDARKAYYDSGNVTPMDYGFGAHQKRSDIKEGKEVLDFERVRQRILEAGS